MAKSFYTERDIEDLVRRGVNSLDINDDVVLTDLAFETAEKLGVKLNRAPKTPITPPPPVIYNPPMIEARQPIIPATAPGSTSSDLKRRVSEAVAARLGGQVDPALLDRIIDRVLDNIGMK
jgi:hypothetical protein